MSEDTLLVGDIGGTNARFALASSESVGFDYAKTLKCADFESVDDAIRHYLSEVSAPDPVSICLAAAGPVIDGAINLTNNHWNLSGQGIVESMNVTNVQLINDFEAIAMSIPYIEEIRLGISLTQAVRTMGRIYVRPENWNRTTSRKRFSYQFCPRRR